MTPLRRRMIEDLQVRNFAASTQDNYVRCVARFARHFGCSPDRLGPEQIRAFQVHLVTQAKTSYGVCEAPAGDPDAGGDPAVARRHPQPQAPGDPDDVLRGRAADLGGGPSPRRGHR